MSPARHIKSDHYPIVAVPTFIAAIRDSGYKGTSWAIAELVDNAIEADATMVAIEVQDDKSGQRIVSVTDNGCGMAGDTMQLALQFGGSTRFDARRGLGRYGMGLPCSALSQARRVEVHSWQTSEATWTTHLDLDEVVSGRTTGIPTPQRLPVLTGESRPGSGTLVRLLKCDRLDFRRTSALLASLHRELGRLFRQFLPDRLQLTINGAPVAPIDPLFLRGIGLVGADPFGPPIQLPVAAPGSGKPSIIQITFSELPITEWHELSNEDKRRHGIAKGAGVSVLRAGREVDRGWYFMGGKRRENYDDWWRCEVAFEPDLDELFGVTHTKQRINPTDALEEILTPHIESVAHELNSRVRRTFASLHKATEVTTAAKRAEGADGFMEPPRAKSQGSKSHERQSVHPRVTGLQYRVRRRELNDTCFMVPVLAHHRLQLDINVRHVFYEKVYRPFLEPEPPRWFHSAEAFELVLLAFARAECGFRSTADRAAARRVRERWGNVLATFLS